MTSIEKIISGDVQTPVDHPPEEATFALVHVAQKYILITKTQIFS